MMDPLTMASPVTSAESSSPPSSKGSEQLDDDVKLILGIPASAQGEDKSPLPSDLIESWASWMQM